MSAKTCAGPCCDRPTWAKGLCGGHYQQLRKGTPLRPLRKSLTTEARFFQYVRQVGDCWEWTGRNYSGGYGDFNAGPSSHTPAHRWSYEFLRADIPAGLVIDHLCRNPPCVNPWHLEPVTPRENALRGIGPSAINAAKTHCDSGHEFTPENTRIRREGTRICRACHRERARGYLATEGDDDRLRHSQRHAEAYAVVKAAAKALGLPVSHYIERHGRSIETARQYIEATRGIAS